MRTCTPRLNKFPWQSLQLILPLVATAWLTAPTICHANVIIAYTGNNFDSFTSPYTGTDRVTASITLAAPLGGNLAPTQVTPLAFSISDGVGTLDDTSPIFFDSFFFGTDASGAITNWDVFAVVFGQGQEGHSIRTFSGGGQTPVDIGVMTAEGTLAFGFIFGHPGSWTTIPEPPTVTELGPGLLGLLGLLWWRRRQNRDFAR
jgi:MYXO-CTERM domain-containing protein